MIMREHDDYFVILILRFCIMFGIGSLIGLLLSDLLISEPKYGDKMEDFFEILFLYIVPLCTAIAVFVYLRDINEYSFVKKRCAFLFGLIVFFLGDAICRLNDLLHLNLVSTTSIVLFIIPLLFTGILLAQGWYLKRQSKKYEREDE